MLRSIVSILATASILLAASCGSESSESTPTINLIGTLANGIPLVDGTINVATDARFEMTFSSTLDASKFEAAFSLSSTNGEVADLTHTYTNAGSKAIIEASLSPNTDYTLSLASTPIGTTGSVLTQAVSLRFTTRDDGGTITELPPCTSASNDCLRSIQITDSQGNSGSFDCYSTFPLDLDNARWENLTTAIIVIHGIERDADQYFSHLVRTLRDLGKEEEAILIAPFFKSGSDVQAGDIYWGNSAWREGGNSQGDASASSFMAIDQIIDILAAQSHFPVLQKVIIVGHSSGALFTHVYAAANRSETQYDQLDFEYVVANSQYFYYPDDVRWDESTAQFGPVSGCSSFDIWPMGYRGAPSYLSATPETQIDQQIITRKVTYLLGTADVSTTGTLNTSDCHAVVLGKNRFARGENIHRLMLTNHASTHQSTKVTVSGIGHNGQAMLQSTSFQSWLTDRL